MHIFKTNKQQILFWRSKWRSLDKKREKKEKQFVPDIHFTKVRIFNKEYNIHEFEKKDSNSQNIV